MTAFAYYNEFDPFAASWLEELIRDGLIAPGVVDRRDIQDVLPSELKDFTQCHFFAGIGVWSLSLRLAGWPDDRPIWTGSCPCQPFSAAGKGAGFDDERHLWPAFHWLIARGKPATVPLVGEQVASKDGRTWFDLVSADMEGLDHACGAVDTSAAGVGAPFIGQRLYWLATANHTRLEGRPGVRQCTDQLVAGQIGLAGRMAASYEQRHKTVQRGITGSICDNGSSERSSDRYERCNRPDDTPFTGANGGIPLHPLNYWRDADWLLCRDPDGARFRPVEPGTFPLVDARSVVNRLGQVRGAGNALNVSQATCFIEAVMEHLAS